jgi:cysteine desulfurase
MSKLTKDDDFMAATRAYLDHNATTPLRPAVREAVVRALLETGGNPSSVHFEGRAARKALEVARHQVASAVGGEAKSVIFTSGATEGLSLLLRPSPAITPSSGAKQTTRLLVLATEHSAALAGGGFEASHIERIPVDGDGLADLKWLEARLAALAGADGFAPVTVAVQLANSETGVVQPIGEVSSLTKRFGALLVVDAVAACGKIPLDLSALNADAIVIAAHKFGGPKGAGAVVLNGATLQLNTPLLKGGGQEMRRL